MKELSVSQAQKQFTALLSVTEITTIIDKKSHLKKTVLMPYALYEQLIANNKHKITEQALELDSLYRLTSRGIYHR